MHLRKLVFLLSAFVFSHAAFANEEAIENPTAAETGDAGPFQAVTFNNGIQFLHPDDKGEINLRFRMQNRADFTFLNNKQNDATQMDWQVRRLRLRFGGYWIDPKLTFNIQLSFSRGDMDWSNSKWPNVVRDAILRYEFNPYFQMAFGQGKLPGNRQRVISSGDLQFVDRSIVNASFNIDRDFGFQAQIQNANASLPVNLKLAVTSGEGRNLPQTSDEGLGYVARAEILPLGEFLRNGDYFESDLVREQDPKISFGLGAAFFRQSNRAGATIGQVYTSTGDPNSGIPLRRDQTSLFSDLIFKYRGWSILGEWMHRNADHPIVGTTAILVGQGLNVQVGKFLTHYFEPR